MHSAKQVQSLHVYKTGSCLGDDKIIKAQDKATVLYYLKASRHDTHWQFTLHVDGSNGAILCRVSSGYLGPPLISDLSPAPMVINITSERQPIHVECRKPDGTHWFKGLDDKDYYWRTSAQLWRNDMQCLDTKGEIVATYRTTTMALSKDGELCIYPPGQSMIDLLIATSLAIRMPSH